MDYGIGTYVFVIGALIAIGLNVFSRPTLRINFLWITNLIFILAIVPKIVLLLVEGHQVLLTSGSFLSLPSVTAAIYLVCAFVITINLTYLLTTIMFPPSAANLYRPQPMQVAIRLPLFLVIGPLFLVSFAIFLATAEVSLETIFLKPELLDEGEITAAYIFQKLSQVIKCGVFLYLIKLLAMGQIEPRDRLLFMGVTVLTMLVFLASGQRSGIGLVLLQVLICFQVVGILNARSIAITGVVFAAVNAVVLAARLTGTRASQSSGFAETILRRYFFDVEKIAGILEFSSVGRAYLTQPSLVFSDFSSRPELNQDLHLFLGEYAFGINSGVPPTVLGDIVFNFGGAWVIPLTIVLTGIVIAVERWANRTNDPRGKLALIASLATAYFFLLNSDVIATINRMALESAFLVAAIALGMFFKPISQMGTASALRPPPLPPRSVPVRRG